MRRHEQPSGIVIEIPDDVTIETATATMRAGRGPLPRGPVDVSAGSPSAAGGDPVVAAMVDQDLVLVDTFDIVPGPSAATRGPREPSRLTVDVDENEDSAILFEQ